MHTLKRNKYIKIIFNALIMASITYTKEYSLDNVIIGDIFRMIQGEETIHSSIGQSSKKEKETFYNIKDKFNTNKNITNELEKKDNLKYTYFMKNTKDVKLNTSYSQDFISSARESLEEDKKINTSLFYDKVIDNLSGLNYVQIKNNFYFLNSNKFSDSFDNLISRKI